MSQHRCLFAANGPALSLPILTLSVSLYALSDCDMTFPSLGGLDRHKSRVRRFEFPQSWRWADAFANALVTAALCVSLQYCEFRREAASPIVPHRASLPSAFGPVGSPVPRSARASLGSMTLEDARAVATSTAVGQQQLLADAARFREVQLAAAVTPPSLLSLRVCVCVFIPSSLPPAHRHVSSRLM